MQRSIYEKKCFGANNEAADCTEDESVINAIDALCDRAENIINNNRISGDPFMDVEMKPTSGKRQIFGNCQVSASFVIL